MRHVVTCLLVVCALASCGLARAADDDSAMYEGSTLVNSQNTAERNVALPNALVQVLVKISGRRDAAQAARGQLAIAAKIAQDVRYTAESQTINGAPIYRQKLTAHFPRDAVDAIVAGSGLPVWPSPRAPIVLWLVIDDGHGARMVGTAHVNAVKSLTDRAFDRGIGVLLPAASPAENAVALAAVAQPQAVATASASYGSPVQLVGKLARSAAGWNAQWVLLDGGAELARWSETNPDARLAMANGADGAADALARKYARMAAGGPAGTFTVEIDGVRNGDDYVRAMGYLESIGIVRKIVLLGANDARLRMQLELATGIEGLRSVLAAGEVLDLQADGPVPVFRLRP